MSSHPRGAPTAQPPRAAASRALGWALIALVVALIAIAASLLRPGSVPVVGERKTAAATTAPAGAGTSPVARQKARAPEPPLSLSAIQRAYTLAPPMAQRMRFFGSFISYASVGEAENLLHDAGYSPELESRHLRVPDSVPPSNHDILRVTQYEHLGVRGKLELMFFNDRLYQLEFEPEDATTYRKAFVAKWPNLQREQSGRSETTRGPLRIASSLDLAVSDVGQVLHSRPFVLWQDLRLIRQRDNWDIQFSRKAVQ